MILENFKIKETMKGVSLLLIRLIVGYGFYNAGFMKILDAPSNAMWFESIGIPFPVVNTWLSGCIELIGSVFLILGIFTRSTSIILIFVMLTAIFTAHLGNGFSAANNGYEINVYYIIMLYTLIEYGSGKHSLPSFLSHKKIKKVIDK
ncbi:DoxX family protein [Chryseobacterium sp. ON_d1]|uniref:DoxX family protein n=1 Tax=Chryseobacterium sp. ON_d1 TaxID=2583211 RepID=UPI00115B01DD|nr:DoxX family protein [Chryseobacterium sp. ON_d1]GEJ43609.1 hypothetical protein CRS_02170 [Chryseobacterium sp. ON_d1]